MEKTTVWYSIINCGDGSASLDWFLTAEKAERDQEGYEDSDEDSEDYGLEIPGQEWGEACYGCVETFTGSDIHKKAVANG